MAAPRWIAAGPSELGETNGVVDLAGDSAGGALATLACLRLRDEDQAALPDLQLLLYAKRT